MKENCTECKHHDVFWGGSGCNLLNDGERCKFEPKVMTNADRIRAMSDEELANMLTDFSNNGGWVTETGREICYERHIEGLKQPTE